jgi:YD repeat-containing protein
LRPQGQQKPVGREWGGNDEEGAEKHSLSRFERRGSFYDVGGRPTSAGYPDGGSEQDQYDAAGNRTVKTSTAGLVSTAVPAAAFVVSPRAHRR